VQERVESRPETKAIVLRSAADGARAARDGRAGERTGKFPQIALRLKRIPT
jgi:hypothetical protein